MDVDDEFDETVPQGMGPYEATADHADPHSSEGKKPPAAKLDREQQLELTSTLHKVSSSLPTVAWTSSAAAFKVCAEAMPQGTRNDQCITFVRDTLHRVLFVMVGLNSIEKEPKCFTDLQRMWEKGLKLEFTECFFKGLANCMRMLVRIGRVCSPTELLHWPEQEQPHSRTGDWAAAMEVMLDEQQHVYINDHLEGPNDVWHCVFHAFIVENGFELLASMLDTSVFDDHGADKLLDKDQILHCRIAKIIKNLVQRQLVSATSMGDAVKFESIMDRMVQVSKAATSWLKARLAVNPDKLTQMGRTKDSEVLDVLGELIGPEEAVELARNLLAVPSVTSHHAGIRLVRQFRDRNSALGAAFAAVPVEFLGSLRERFNGEGDLLVKQLVSAKVVNKRVIVDTFEELNLLMLDDPEEAAIATLWGELGLRCMQTNDERTRDIGIGLLEGLNHAQPRFAADDLLPFAERALDWLKNTLEAEGPELVKNLETTNLKEADRVINLLTTLFQVLQHVASPRIEEIAGLWFDTAIRCLRCLGKYPIREMGFVMVQEAIRLNMYSARVHTYVHEARPRLGRLLHAIISAKENLERFLDSIFTEQFAHHAVIRLVSTWLVDTYYRDYCYEDDLVDLMKYLVDASVNDWGVDEAVTDLLVKVTVTNISIKSLNSLCSLFKECVQVKATASAGQKLILQWIDKTRQKKWVIGVQERVLNLLWTMLINKSSESEDDTHKVLDYFKNQFSNIKGHLVDWGGVHAMSEKEKTARNCIIRCANDCLVEIKNACAVMGGAAAGAALPPPPGGGPAHTLEDLRDRATQSASLLNIVLDLVDNLRPEVLREMHQRDPQGMVDVVFEELFLAVPHEDVDSSAVESRLTLLAALCGYLWKHAPLTPGRVEELWERLGPEHLQVFLRWQTMVLAPPADDHKRSVAAADDTRYFFPGDDAVAREAVLSRLRHLVVSRQVDLYALGEDAQECFLSLFLWTNKDAKAVREDYSASVILSNIDEDDEQIEVISDNIQAYDALAVLSLDQATETADNAVKCLLNLSDAVFRASARSAGAAAKLAPFDLFQTVFARLAGVAEAGAGGEPAGGAPTPAQVNHWLAVVHRYLERLAECNARCSHGSMSEGRPMVLAPRMAEAPDVPLSIVVHSNMRLADVLDECRAAAGGVADGEWVLKVAPVSTRDVAAAYSSYSVSGSTATATATPAYYKELRGKNLSLEELGVDESDVLYLYPAPQAGSDLALQCKSSPADQLAGHDSFLDVLFALLERPEACEAAWQVLQFIPTASKMQDAVRQDAAAFGSAKEKWTSLLDSSKSFWRKIYLCQIMQSVLLPSSRDPSSEGVVEWRRSFIEDGGLDTLLSILGPAEGSADLLGSMDAFTRSASLATVVRVVHYCITNALLAVTTGAEGEEGGGEAPADLDVMPPAEPPRTRRQFSVTSAELVKSTIDFSKVMGSLFSVIRVGSAAELTQGEIDAVSYALATVTLIVQKTEDEKWAEMSRSFPLDTLVRLLVHSPVQRLRREVAATFEELIAGGNYALPSSPEAGAALVPAPEVLGPLFTSRVEGMDLVSETASDFFEVVGRLILTGGIWMDAGAMFRLLLSKLTSFSAPILDVSADTVLVGVLATLGALVSKHVELSTAPEMPGLLDAVFDTFLMRLPWAASPAFLDAAQASGEGSVTHSSRDSGPICGTEDSRLAACDLLCALARVENSGGEANCAALCTKMAAFAAATTPPPAEHMVCRASEDIKLFARPGLVNTANRCYMNSLCQQLASLDVFRRGILSVPVSIRTLEVDAEEEAKAKAAKDKDDGEPTSGTWQCPLCTYQNEVGDVECAMCGTAKPEGVKILAAGVDPEEARKEKEKKSKEQKAVLREFQRTLRFLTHGEMTAFDAESLLGIVGQHLSLQFPAEQQNDTKEFMDKLLEELELELSNSVHKDLVNRTFGATTVETKVRQKDGKEANRSETKTSTFYMGLQVEGMGSLDEAMGHFFEPAIREVDDEEEVGEDGKPIKNKFEYTTRFADLPRVLCVQLSRFSFDYSRGLPIKHNHRVEFPEVLDVTKYCEKPELGGAEYRLRGILVHMGPSANQGHYYSIIKEGDLRDPDSSWLKYNDSHVSPVDSIEDECFGGEHTARREALISHSSEKNWNAYLLFYESCEPLTAAQKTTEAELADAVQRLALDDELGMIGRIQEKEVRDANEKLWRRNLLYQLPLLRSMREMIDDRVDKLSRSQTALLEGELAHGLFHMSFSLFENVVLHCEQTAHSADEMKEWNRVLLRVLKANPEGAHEFLQALATPASPPEGKAAASPSPAIGPRPATTVVSLGAATDDTTGVLGAGPDVNLGGRFSSFVSRVVLQVGSKYPVKSIRESGSRLIATAAASLAGELSGSPFSAVVIQLLELLDQVAKEREVMEGFLTLILSLAEYSELRGHLLQLDLPAFLVHVYMGSLSPAVDWPEEETITAGTGKPLPRIQQTTRRSGTQVYYSPPPIDHRMLLLVLASLLRPLEPEGDEPTAALPPLPELSGRLLRNPKFLARVVDHNPIAGVKPLPPVVYTPEEEDRLIAAEGWKQHKNAHGRTYWYRSGAKYTVWDKPKPRKPTSMQMDERAFEASAPGDLLLVVLALFSPADSDLVVQVLVEGIARSYPSSWQFKQRVRVLGHVLSLDTDELQTTRLLAAADQLLDAINALRSESTTATRAMKDHTKCAHMEVLVYTVRALAEPFPETFEPLAASLDWVKTWFERYRPPMRVTLQDLQGHWTNSQDQPIHIVEDQCSFSHNEPVAIKLEATGTYSVPGWTLSQERSTMHSIMWVNQSNHSETVQWTRPTTTTYNNNTTKDDYDQVTYGPFLHPPHHETL